MHARLWGEIPSLGGTSAVGSSGRRLSGEGGTRIGNKRRSMCERINEEREDINLESASQHDSLSPTTPLADFDHLSIYKRHHRPRPIIPPSSPSPSTNLIDILLSDHPICLNQLPSLPHLSPLLPLPSQKSSKPTPTTPNKKMSLRPQDSLSARTRGASHIDFRTATTGVIGKATRNELSQLVNTVHDPQTRKASLFTPH